MNKADFKLSYVDQDKQDYWFEISGESKEELTAQYFEQGMIEVSHIVYSLSDDMWAIQREFLFNTEMIMPTNDALKTFVKGLAKEAYINNENNFIERSVK